MQAAMKDHLWYRRFHKKEEVEIAVREWLRVKSPMSTAKRYLRSMIADNRN
jgi:hypothetical protein